MPNYENDEASKLTRVVPTAGCRYVTIEGLNGVGKSTVVNRYLAEHLDVTCFYPAHPAYLADTAMKKHALFEATPIAGALYYLAALADQRRALEANGGLAGRKLLSDRSIWSTIAAAYAKDPAVLPQLLDAVAALQGSLLVPQNVVVLKADFDTCRIRIESRGKGAEWDRDTRLVFDRKYRFYDLLAEAGHGVTFVDASGTPDQVYAESAAILPL